MPRLRCNLYLLPAFLTLSASAALSQQIVHALAGTVSAINAPAKTITVNNDIGTGGTFAVLASNGDNLQFDKILREDATPAGKFAKQGDHVIVYYVADGFNSRTAVALRDLGVAKVDKVSGTIAAYDRHDHRITIKTDAGARESFQIDDKTVVETAMGVSEGRRFDPGKGDQVRVTATPATGTENALFINAN
jgi:hypothetical protein